MLIVRGCGCLTCILAFAADHTAIRDWERNLNWTFFFLYGLVYTKELAFFSRLEIWAWLSKEVFLGVGVEVGSGGGDALLRTQGRALARHTTLSR